MIKLNTYYNQHKSLTLRNPLYKKQVARFLLLPVVDDVGTRGDITTNFFVSKIHKSSAVIAAKENGIVAGVQEVVWLFRYFGVSIRICKKDGEKIHKKEHILELCGHTRILLMLERSALNCLQRMSGIATITNALVQKFSPSTLLCATRKTQWGLLDKRAVCLGGGGTHRLGLNNFVLIKDTHLMLGRNIIGKAIQQIKEKKIFWEIEVASERQALWALQYRPDAIMLDNMTPTQAKHVTNKLKKIRSDIIIEASGGITPSNIAAYAQAGVDVVSMGALTHSVHVLDIHMRLV